MLYCFKKAENTTETQNLISAVYAESVVTDQTCQKWFAKFCARDFLLKDAPWSGRPVDSNQIKTLRTISIIPLRWKLTFKISKSSLENHLH